MTIEVTGAMALAILEDVVDAKGEDYVYVNPKGEKAGSRSHPSCFYLHGEEPGCIVGHVMRKLGVPADIMRDEENNTSPSLIDAINASDSVDIEFTGSANHVLRAAQSRQDGGRTWGEALEYAKMSYAHYKMGPGLSREERKALIGTNVSYRLF